MGQIEIQTIIVITSAVFGILLLIASSLFLDLYRKAFEICVDAKTSGPNSLCKDLILIFTGACFGIIASIIQILAAGICFRSSRAWCVANIFVIFFAIIAFSLPMSTKFIDQHLNLVNQLGSSEEKDRILFFLVWTPMDFILLFFATIYTCFIGGQNYVA